MVDGFFKIIIKNLPPFVPPFLFAAPPFRWKLAVNLWKLRMFANTEFAYTPPPSLQGSKIKSGQHLPAWAPLQSVTDGVYVKGPQSGRTQPRPCWRSATAAGAVLALQACDHVQPLAVADHQPVGQAFSLRQRQTLGREAVNPCIEGVQLQDVHGRGMGPAPAIRVSGWRIVGRWGWGVGLGCQSSQLRVYPWGLQSRQPAHCTPLFFWIRGVGVLTKPT